MAIDYRIPRPQAAFLDRTGYPTTEWYNWLKKLDALFQTGDAGLQAQITQIAYILGSPDGTVVNIPPFNENFLPTDTIVRGEVSLNYSGTLASGQVVITLLNDVGAPGNSYYYGTDALGVKGWHVLDLASLADIDFITTPPADGDVLTFDNVAGKWIPAPASAGSAQGGIGVSIGTYDVAATALTAGLEVTSIADAGYSLTGEWFLWCYPSGSIQIDVWADTFSSVPNVTDSITGGVPPAVVANTFATGTFPGGPIAIDRTDTIIAHIDSSASVKWVKLLLVGTRT